MKKKISLLLSALLLILACRPTIEVVEIKQLESDIPVKMLYNKKTNRIEGMQFYLRYEIFCKSPIKRKLSYVNYFNSYDNSYSNYTCAFYSLKDGKLQNIGIQYDKKISRSKDTLINLIRYEFNDTIFNSTYFAVTIDSFPEITSDTSFFFEYGTLKELKAEYPELLEFHFKGDSIKFEFDDSELPFYVRKSIFPHKIANESKKRKTLHPQIWLPMSENEKAEFIDFYLEDINGNNISEFIIGDEINLVIISKNAAGYEIVIPFDNKKCDFEYKGLILKKNKLYVTINQDIQKEKIKVVKQHHPNIWKCFKKL